MYTGLIIMPNSDYIVRISEDTWTLKSPGGEVLLSDNPLPFTLPKDIVEKIEQHNGSLIPIYRGEYQVVDERVE